MDYKKAGVDIEAGYRSVELMKKFVQATNRPEVWAESEGSQARSARRHSRIWRTRSFCPVLTVWEQS